MLSTERIQAAVENFKPLVHCAMHFKSSFEQRVIICKGYPVMDWRLEDDPIGVNGLKDLSDPCVHEFLPRIQLDSTIQNGNYISEDNI